MQASFHTSDRINRVQVKGTAYNHDSLWINVKLPSSHPTGPTIEFVVFAENPAMFLELGQQIVTEARKIERRQREFICEREEEIQQREDKVAEMARANREALRIAQAEESSDNEDDNEDDSEKGGAE